MKALKLTITSIFLILLFCSLSKKEKGKAILTINNYNSFYDFIRLDSAHYTHLYMYGGFSLKTGESNINLDSFFVKLAKCRNLTHLKISNFHLKSIDKRILKLGKLNSLDLGENEIDTISDQINNLKTLFEINLKFNKLKYFNNLCNLTSLRYVTLSHNLINEIPDEISNLKHLKVIHIDYNNISELPCNLSNFMVLELSVSNNNIPKKLNACFCKTYTSFGVIGIPHDAYIDGADTCKNFYINPVW